MKNIYKFRNAAPLLQVLRENENKLIGQQIGNFYCGIDGYNFSCGPAVFELDKCCVIVEYYFYSDITVYFVDRDAVKKDASLNFLYRDMPYSRNLENWVYETDFPYIGRKIESIDIKRFSHEFEINAATGETRPDGGDYFSLITVGIENGGKIYISAAPAFYDGYMEIWTDHDGI